MKVLVFALICTLPMVSMECLALNDAKELLHVEQEGEVDSEALQLPAALPHLEPAEDDSSGEDSGDDNHDDELATQPVVSAEVTEAVLLRLNRIRALYERWKINFKEWHRKQPKQAYGFAVGLGSTIMHVHSEGAVSPVQLIGQPVENTVNQFGNESYWGAVHQQLLYHKEDREFLVSLFQIADVMPAGVLHNVDNAFLAALVLSSWGVLGHEDALAFEDWAAMQGDENVEGNDWLETFHQHIFAFLVWLSDRRQQGMYYAPGG